jgi:DegV family protein with EDD domain
VLPCYINYDNRSIADDGKELDRESFYRQMSAMRPPYPTTAAMSPGLAEEVIRQVASECDHVFIITVASALSGVYNVMRLAASKLPAGTYTLIDSETTTMGLGYQVLIGAETAAETGDVAQVRDAILRTRQHTHVYAALSTLEFLRRSGRVGWATASIGGMLQIKPLLHVRDGEAASVARVRTFSRVIDEMISRVESHMPLDRVTLLYACNEEQIAPVATRLQAILPTNVQSLRITPTIGVHIGPDSVGVALVSSAWRA